MQAGIAWAVRERSFQNLPFREKSRVFAFFARQSDNGKTIRIFLMSAEFSIKSYVFVIFFRIFWWKIKFHHYFSHFCDPNCTKFYFSSKNSEKKSQIRNFLCEFIWHQKYANFYHCLSLGQKIAIFGKMANFGRTVLWWPMRYQLAILRAVSGGPGLSNVYKNSFKFDL